MPALAQGDSQLSMTPAAGDAIPLASEGQRSPVFVLLSLSHIIKTHRQTFKEAHLLGARDCLDTLRAQTASFYSKTNQDPGCTVLVWGPGWH